MKTILSKLKGQKSFEKLHMKTILNDFWFGKDGIIKAIHHRTIDFEAGFEDKVTKVRICTLRSIHLHLTSKADNNTAWEQCHSNFISQLIWEDHQTIFLDSKHWQKILLTLG